MKIEICDNTYNIMYVYMCNFLVKGPTAMNFDLKLKFDPPNDIVLDRVFLCEIVLDRVFLW